MSATSEGIYAIRTLINYYVWKGEPSITIAELKKIASSYPVKSQLNESFLSYSSRNIFLTELTKLPEIRPSVSIYVSSNQELLFKTIKREGVLSGKLKNQVEEIWETFWTAWVANPISVIAQFTFLLFYFLFAA